VRRQPTEIAVIIELKKDKDRYISGEELAEKSSVSRAAVWKHIKSLKEKGYEIEAVPRLGYRLISAPDLLIPEEIIPILKTGSFGKKVVHRQTVDSTNDLAKELAGRGEAEGTVVLSEEQSSGKGRLERKWTSPQGGIWLSIILRPKVLPSEASRFTLLAAVSAAKAIEKLGIEPEIKWPNDILIDGKKVCGILLELSAQPDKVDYLVVGFGVNANFKISELPRESRGRATTLADILGKKVNRQDFVAGLLLELEKDYKHLMKDGWKDIKKEWTIRSKMLHEKVELSTLQGVVEGEFIGVDESGAMRLRLPQGQVKTFAAGDVTVKKRLT